MRSNYSVTCICPTYRRPRFVEQTVRLFLAQTWQNAELLIYEDSPEGERVSIPQHPRVKLVTLEDRMTMGAKHNMGLAASQGEFITHWDDDDWQAPRRLVKQLEDLVLKGGDVNGYVTEYLLTVGDARFWKFDSRYTKRNERGCVGNATIPIGVPFMDGTAMFRRGVIGAAKYPDIAVGQKVLFLDAMRTAGAELHGLPNDGTYVYVRHGSNTWQYYSDKRLKAQAQPSWFPLRELPFYRSAA